MNSKNPQLRYRLRIFYRPKNLKLPASFIFLHDKSRFLHILIITPRRKCDIMQEHAREAVVSALKLPKDVMMGEVLLSFIGRQAVLIENYRSIVLYTDTLVKLQARNCRVLIHGARLTIEYYTSDEMRIAGFIQSVEFESS